MTHDKKDERINVGAGMVPTYHATKSVEEAKAVVEQCRTATEELRRMLDERGVRWKPKRGRKHDGTEWYDQFGVYAEAVQEYSWDGFEHPEGKLLVRRGMGYLTPEQAIAATWGVGTCHDVGDPTDFCCSECGIRMFTDTGETYTMIASDGRTIIKRPNYCPTVEGE